MPDQPCSQDGHLKSRSFTGNGRNSNDGNPQLPVGSELDCAEFESQVQELLDLRRDPESDPAVRMHASQCDECWELLRQFTQLESTLQIALKAKAPSTRGKREIVRPLHPVSQRSREQYNWAAQVASILLVCVTLIGWVATRPPQRASWIPVAVSNDPSRMGRDSLVAGPSGIRPAVHYRSLEQCYELTSELPGVRPLQSSIQVAIAWWWDYLNLGGGQLESLPHHERGFGLNPLLAEANRRV